MPNEDLKRRARAAAAKTPPPVTQPAPVKSRQGVSWGKIAGVIVLVLVVGFIAVSVAFTLINAPYVTAHTRLYLYCADNRLAQDCDQYEETIFNQSTDTVMACQHRWSNPDYTALFNSCIEEAGIVTP